MLTLYIIAHYKRGFELETIAIVLFVLGAILYIVPMLLLSVVVQRNDITDKGTYTILLYAFLTGILPGALTNINVLLAGFLVMLGLQNLLHLRNEKHIKAKIFNASIYICLASLAFFWSIGFMALIFLAISYFEPKNYRNWIIPVIGLLMIYLFANCFTLLFYDSFFSFQEYIDPISFSFESYLAKDQLFSVGVLSICLIFFLGIYLLKFSRKPANIKPILRLIIAYLIITVAIAITSPQNNVSELFFVAIPLAIIGTTYLEMQFHEFAKEINIWVFLLIPFTTLLF
ncbi:hypothetical protein GCM10022258_14790 [Aquimarina gracilis]